MRRACTQLGVVLFKHWVVTVRNWRQTLGQVLTPVLVVVLLVIFQQVANYVLSTHSECSPPPESTATAI